MTYRLLNVEAKYKESPETEFLPHSEERLTLREGDTVRLMLLSASSNTPEGVWVSVKYSRAGKYIGSVIEAPNTISGLARGAEIAFGPEHIAHIWAEDGDLRWFDPGKFALVSKSLLENKQWPAKLIRFKSHNNDFSGWIITSGKEPRGFESDPNNFSSVTLGELANRFPPLASIFARPIGDSFKWSEERKEFVKIVAL